MKELLYERLNGTNTVQVEKRLIIGTDTNLLISVCPYLFLKKAVDAEYDVFRDGNTIYYDYKE